MSNFLIDEETDLLAAEFVLGSLDSAERAKAHELLRSDHTFIAMVRIWERRFGELHLMVEPVDPDPAILRRIKAKVVTLASAAAAAEAKATSKAAEVAPPATPEAQPVAPAPPPMPKAANIELKPLQAAAQAAAIAPSVSGPTGTVEATPPTAPVAPAPEVVVAAAPAQPLTPSPTATEAPASTPAATDQPDVVQASVTQAQEVPPLPAMFPPAAAALVPEVAGPAAELRPPEIKLEPVAKAADIQVPALTPAPRLPERLPERIQGRGTDRGPPEVTIDVIRSRGRWRAFGISTGILILALGGLLAAWRFAPNRLPAKLRPGEFMAAFGVTPPAPKAEAPPARPAPPTGQFDE